MSDGVPTREAEPPSPVETVPSNIPTNKLLRVFRHRDFRLLWTGAFLSFVGSWIQIIAEGYLVFQLTKSEYLLGVVSALGALPVTVFGLFAGSLADMLNKRMLLVAAQIILCSGAMFLAAATYFGFVQFWHIAVVAVVLGTVSSVEMPTRQSITGRVVPPEDLPIAIPVNGFTFNIARPIGSAIGGILLANWGPATCYFINGLSFFALIFAASSLKADLRATAREPQPIMDLITEGALYTFRDRRLRTMFIIEVSVSVFGLFYIVQIPAIADKMLHIGKRLGEAYFSVGAGAMLALVMVTTLAERPIKAWFLKGAVTFIGIALILLGFARTPWVAYPIFALLGFASVSMFNTCNTLFQTLSPDRLRGRVLAMHIWAVSGSAPIGIYTSGIMAERLGLPVALQTGGVLVLCAAAYVWLYKKGLQGV